MTGREKVEGGVRVEKQNVPKLNQLEGRGRPCQKLLGEGERREGLKGRKVIIIRIVIIINLSPHVSIGGCCGGGKVQ